MQGSGLWGQIELLVMDDDYELARTIWHFLNEF